MCVYGGINNSDEIDKAEGLLTKELIGNDLQNKLDNLTFSFNNNLYPTLKELENTEIAKIAASPIYLNDKNKHNNVTRNFTVNLENSVAWKNSSNKVQIINKNVKLISQGWDTLVANIENVKKIVPINVTNIPENYFTISAPQLKNVSPKTKNYEIPIYIESSENISNFLINKLVIAIDKNIFAPKPNHLTKKFNNLAKIILENIQIDYIYPDEEKILCSIIGDVLLGNIDNSGIVIKEIEISEIKSENIELENGFLTTDICSESGGGLIEILAMAITQLY